MQEQTKVNVVNQQEVEQQLQLCINKTNLIN